MTKYNSIPNIWRRLMAVYKKNYLMAISIAFTFGIQYCFYPGVVSEKRMDFISIDWWFPLLSTFHSFFDTLGRYLAGVGNIVPKKIFLPVSFGRVILIIPYVLIAECVREGILGQDWFLILLFFIFSITCGYLSTLGMNYGSDETTVN